MSVRFPEGVDSPADLQIWNNAAFDNGEISEDLTANRQSWGSLKSVFENPKASFDSVSGKENQGIVNQIPSVSSPAKPSIATPFKPVNAIGAIEKSKIKALDKRGIRENSDLNVEARKGIRDAKVIENEIEEIESEIFRLSLTLEALKIEKAEKSVKGVEKRARIVPAKFMEPKSGVKNGEDKKKIEEVSSRTKSVKRGVSLGPGEIVSGVRRGMSVGPSDILGSVRLRQLGKQEMITPLQSRRKSCFWKLQEIDEVKAVVKERGKCLSVSPKSRKAVGKSQVLPRQAVTTVASRKAVKKEDSVITSIQPKKLFKEGEKSVPITNKKALRSGRVVASRYNQTPSQASAMRKRSLPDNDKDDGKRCDKKRSLSAGKSRPNPMEGKNLGTESRAKKRWEIPSEIVVHGSDEAVIPSPLSAVKMLPRIRIARCTDESPRNSGPAKKVAELVGRKSFFSNDDEDEEDELSLCQVLTYAEEEVV